MSLEGRLHGKRLTATATDAGDGKTAIASPAVGWWHPAVGPGAVVRGGDVIGVIDVLGTRVEVIAPASAHGAVVDVAAQGRAVSAVGHGAALLVLDPRGAIREMSDEGGAAARAVASGLVFTAPISGRFFAKPGPGKPPFVAAGAILDEGQTVCMLEVMKTFHRVTYGGAGLPARARVVAVLVDDEADVTMGQAILKLEDAS
jgi:acetyl-CoA carboxylase biotin carboxyl carrier protein